MHTLSEQAKRILNDPERLQRQSLWFSRLQNLFDGSPDPWLRNRIMTLEGQWLYKCQFGEPCYTEPEEAVVAALEELALKLDSEPDVTDRFAPVSVEFGFFMVHFIDRILGAEVFYKDGQWNARYLTNPVGELAMPDMERDPTWDLARRAAEAFLEQDVRLPLFGMPTLSSVLNIAVNLYGGDFLIALAAEPEAALHDMEIISGVIESAHRWYISRVPQDRLQPVISGSRTQPYGFGQLCGCTTQLVSGRMYREMIAPFDDRLLALYKGGMIHLCGTHAQHIETFAAMPHLRAVQLNDRAAEDLPLYFKGLRRDQILYVNPCQGMTVEQIIRITGGERTVICAGIDAPQKPAAQLKEN